MPWKLRPYRQAPRNSGSWGFSCCGGASWRRAVQLSVASAIRPCRPGVSYGTAPPTARCSGKQPVALRTGRRLQL